MTSKSLHIIKLGGSLITDKFTPYTENRAVISELLTELVAVMGASSDDIILTHGSGSFGHTSAQKYKITQGYLPQHGLIAASKVQYDADSISQIVKHSAIEVDLPLFSISASGIITDTLQQFASLNQILENGFVPHLWGTMIMDSNQRFKVLSADKIVTLLGEYFIKTGQYQSVSIINVGNYDGVVDHDGNIIPTIHHGNWGEVEKFLQASDSTDVTGGMKSKILEFIEISKLGIECSIINGSIPGALQKAILEPERLSIGTRVLW